MSVFSLSPYRNNRRNFLMDDTQAKHYYDEFSPKFSDIEKHRRYTSGAKLKSPFNNNIYIWGENISNREIFKRRLQGLVDTESL